MDEPTTHQVVEAPAPPHPTPGRRILGAIYAVSLFLMFYILTLFLLVPLYIVVFPFSLKLWRACLDWISWRTYFFLDRSLEFGLGTKYVCWVGQEDPHSNMELLSEFSQPGASGLIVCNHRTRLDWLLTYPFLERWGRVWNLRIVLKDQLRMVPGAGWACQFFGFLFLARSWERDEQHMTAHLNHLMTTEPYPVQLLLYPEGTDLSAENRIRSRAYSTKAGLQHYDYVMHPRAKGFVVTEQHLRPHTRGIWVLTMGYPDMVPQNEGLILSGVAPPSVHFYFQFYPWRDIPADETGSSQWIADRFAEMEDRLRKFYLAGGRFEGAVQVPHPRLAWHAHPLVAIGTWFGLTLFFMWASWRYAIAFWWFVFSNIICFVGTHVFGGFDRIELRYWYERSRSIKRT